MIDTSQFEQKVVILEYDKENYKISKVGFLKDNKLVDTYKYRIPKSRKPKTEQPEGN